MSSSLLQTQTPLHLARKNRTVVQRWRERRLLRAQPLIEHFLFDSCLTDAERGRRARLAIRFGFLGFFFGSLYGVFYFVSGHR